MTTLPEIQKVILNLPPPECERLAEWLSALVRTPRRVAEPTVAYAGSMSFPMTLEEYLQFEEHSRVRHEYIAGEIFAMTGVTKRHNRIAGRLYLAFVNHLKGGSCDAYVSDARVKLQVNCDIHVYYPDVMVVCDRDSNEDRYVANPKLIVEVLSTSTAGIDRHEKRVADRGITALEEYVIVAQAMTVLELRSIGLGIPAARIYEGEST